ncbi:MAG: dethiobiotin synthase [Balneola sp.]|nr:MAG: dethiobiotin synthase [Balneola sp.]
MINFPGRFFVTGTDTEIGKTVVSTMLMCGLDATYWKPIQSGLEEETDTQFVQRVSESGNDRIIPERYRLNTPMSPHASADIDGVSISLSDFELPEFHTKHLIVEGAGGLIVPINWKETVLDLIEKFNIPVLLVARSSLGTLNHTLLSLKALKDRDIDVFGVILSGDIHDSNRETIAHFGRIPVFELERLEEVSYESLDGAFNEIFE